MKIALCNEILRELGFAAQCEYAAALGYDALELAPFTLAANPHLLDRSLRRELRRTALASGLEIAGLHWLLVTPQGLSITSSDGRVRKKTIDVIRALIGLCADLGGRVMVHGSPRQRQIARGDDPEEAWRRAKATFEAIVPEAESSGVIYCIEPLPPVETNFLNSFADAARLVDELNSPFFRTMIDARAASLSETASAADLIETWMPSGKIAHIHLNDRDGRGPGQGRDRFTPILQALVKTHYEGFVSVEPFDFVPDARATAARNIGYLRGILESLGR
ncbi:MAG: sugar phosphate isomerase/epimerase family protein [Acidobacteriota bacterium]